MPRDALRLLAPLFVLTLGMPAWAQDRAEDQVEGEVKDPADVEVKIPTTDWTIRPAAASRPALKHRLHFTELETNPGNAVPLYLRAALLRADARVADEYYAWLNMPPGELPLDKIREAVKKLRPTFEELQLAARRRACDWETPMFEVDNPFGLLLPEMQRMRELTRVLQLKARLEVAEGNWQEALATVRVMLSLSRHTGRQPTLIGGLVGLAVEGVALATLGEVLQVEGAPNLYWPLTALPRPLVDLRHGIDTEAVTLFLLAPELRDVRSGQFTPQEWDSRRRRFVARLRQLSSWADDEGTGKEFLELVKQLEDNQPALPAARARLLERGYGAAELDAMPPSRVLLLDVVEVYDEARDELFKGIELPFPESSRVLAGADPNMATWGRQGVGGALAALLLPAMEAVNAAKTRLQRDVDVLRVIEALRLYAAEHGRLPPALRDIEEVPVPENPFTGEPFGYTLEGNTAVLDCPGPANHRRYRLHLAE